MEGIQYMRCVGASLRAMIPLFSFRIIYYSLKNLILKYNKNVWLCNLYRYGVIFCTNM